MHTYAYLAELHDEEIPRHCGHASAILAADGPLSEISGNKNSTTWQKK